MNPGECLLCRKPAHVAPVHGRDATLVACPICGDYVTDWPALGVIDARFTSKRYVLSGLVRMRKESAGPPLNLTGDAIEPLVNGAPVPQDPIEAAERLLVWAYDRVRREGDFYGRLEANAEASYPVIFARNATEFDNACEHARTLGYFAEVQPELVLSLDGWRRARDLERSSPDSRQAFVAMWFADTLRPAFDLGIKPALDATGYTPVLLNRAEFNEKIDDKIVAEIRRSGPVIADFTGQRQNVYFEAGFAYGLGIAVIWTVRHGDVAAAHFDTRQYNYITWETPDDLRTRLENRIRATLPALVPGVRLLRPL